MFLRVLVLCLLLSWTALSVVSAIDLGAVANGFDAASRFVRSLDDKGRSVIIGALSGDAAAARVAQGGG